MLNIKISSLLFGITCNYLYRSTFSQICASQIASYTKMPNNDLNTSENNDCYESGSSSVAFVTTPDDASAKKIAHLLVTKKLVACVNIIPQITSIYSWEGKVNEDSEVLLMIKTRTSRVDEVAKFVRENHPYSVAEVISLPIENGNPSYLNWISKIVADKK